MRAGRGAGAKTNFEWLHIADNYNDSYFRRQGEVRNIVVEVLLGNGKRSRLADN